MRIFANANYDFLNYRRVAYVVSGVLLAVGIIGGVFWQVRADSWLNYGVDFTGGTLVQVRFTEPASVADLRAIINPEIDGAEITHFGGENEFIFRAPQFRAEGEETSAVIVSALDAQLGGEGFSVERVESVGPTIGEELQQRALLAVLVSFILALIYLAIRFEWRYGTAAVITTIHDIVLGLGFIAIFRLDMSLATVAAVLTIIGYSLNDTIVLFDRVRENDKKMGRREPHESIINRSINEVLPRTVVTSGTTLMALLALLVLGGVILRDFALILMFGIVVGTYSSIFVAAPVLLEIERRWPRKKPAVSKTKVSGSRARAPAGA